MLVQVKVAPPVDKEHKHVEEMEHGGVVRELSFVTPTRSVWRTSVLMPVPRHLVHWMKQSAPQQGKRCQVNGVFVSKMRKGAWSGVNFKPVEKKNCVPKVYVHPSNVRQCARSMINVVKETMRFRHAPRIRMAVHNGRQHTLVGQVEKFVQMVIASAQQERKIVVVRVLSVVHRMTALEDKPAKKMFAYVHKVRIFVMESVWIFKRTRITVVPA